MPAKTKDYEYYDEILGYLIELTIGQGSSNKEYYKGAKYFCRFLLSEIKRHKEAISNGNPHAVSNGQVMPNSLINGGVVQALLDCHNYRIVPPPELLEVVFIQLGCTPRYAGNNISPKQIEYEDLLEKDPNIGIREAARRIGVNASTIKKWKDKPHKSDWDIERYRELQKITRFDEFIYDPRKLREGVA
jgi:hypothetical protein